MVRGETILNQLFQSRLKYRRLCFPQVIDRLLVEIPTHDVEEFSTAGRGHTAEMPEPQNNDFHARFSKTQGFARNQSKVFKTAASIVSSFCQPVSRIFFVSRKINGLSPTQPFSPPVNSSSGSKPRRPHIQEIESRTVQ